MCVFVQTVTNEVKSECPPPTAAPTTTQVKEENGTGPDGEAAPAKAKVTIMVGMATKKKENTAKGILMESNIDAMEVCVLYTKTQGSFLIYL